MDTLRFNRATFVIIKRWFDAVTKKYQKQQYEHGNMCNIDESGFGIREL